MIKIHCSYDKMVKIGSLKPNPRNPNTHPKKQIERLAKIIKRQGWRKPITVSKRSGFIVSSHARLEAAKLLKLKEVPVDYQNYESDALEYADLIADNQIAELSEMDYPLLKDGIVEFDTGEEDIELTGFDQVELKDIIDHEGIFSKVKDGFYSTAYGEASAGFQLTFIIEKEHEGMFRDYIKDVGKEKLKKMLVDEVLKNAG